MMYSPLLQTKDTFAPGIPDAHAGIDNPAATFADPLLYYLFTTHFLLRHFSVYILPDPYCRHSEY